MSEGLSVGYLTRALRVDAERCYRVPPLSLPAEEVDCAAELRGSDAVELFRDRARAHDANFALHDSTAGVVASLCRRLDGIPLAIELAAARVASMSLVDLNDRLDQRFRLLTGGARTLLPRQQTLQATVDWSFGLLNASEQAALSRLSVFVGGFELEAAEVVCAREASDTVAVADVLDALVNKCLVDTDCSSGSLRYRLLDTIRQYAGDHLTATTGELGLGQARDDHATYYRQMAAAAGPELTGPSQGPWLKRLDRDWDNIRSALAYIAADPARTAEFLEFGVALQRFIFTRGHQEPIASLRAALQQASPVPAILRARALYVTGCLVGALTGPHARFELPTAKELHEKALGIARDVNDQELMAEILTELAYVA
ncbi:MAG TPA: hypothetical protein VME46_07500, partial [Acidimicrobiales bacterium]|nr:hypothetical protein [Acidimicrobiales bacterium]